MEASTQEPTSSTPLGRLIVDAMDAGMVLTIVRVYRDKLYGLKSNPEGMTHGDVQDHLASCDRILG